MSGALAKLRLHFKDELLVDPVGGPAVAAYMARRTAG
jgi:hypothetical protein